MPNLIHVCKAIPYMLTKHPVSGNQTKYLVTGLDSSKLQTLGFQLHRFSFICHRLVTQTLEL